MTTDLKRSFFETFEIKQREYTQCTLMGCRYVYKNCNNCQFHNVYKVDYPQISDRILLELIVIIMFHEDLYGFSRNIKDLKENVLKQLIQLYQSFSVAISYDGEYQQTAELIKQQVQALFKEGKKC